MVYMKTHQITLCGICLVFAVLFTILLIGGTSSRGKAQSSHGARFTARCSTNFTFDSVPLGSAAERTFFYHNTGQDTLFIQSLELNADSVFTIQFATLTLPPHGEGKVVVQFAPQEARSYSGNIAFDVANGVASPRLALSGSGMPSVIQSPKIPEFARTVFGSGSADHFRSKGTH